MVYLLLADGFETIEALTPLDMLRRAKVEVKTVGITGKVVTSAQKVPVVADITPKEIKAPYDLIILPGGLPGTTNLDAWPKIDELLKETLTSGGRIAAICAAPTILGKRGYLEGKEATCYPGMEQELLGRIPTEKRVVTDGLITTGRGMGASVEFGAELVSLLAGKETANQILHGICSKEEL